MRTLSSILLLGLLACGSTDSLTGPSEPPAPPEPPVIVPDSTPLPPPIQPPNVDNQGIGVSPNPMFRGSNALGDSLEWGMEIEIDSQWVGTIYLTVTPCATLDAPVPCTTPAPDSAHGNVRQRTRVVQRDQFNRFNWIYSGQALIKRAQQGGCYCGDSVGAVMRLDYNFSVYDANGTLIQAMNSYVLQDVTPRRSERDSTTSE